MGWRGKVDDYMLGNTMKHHSLGDFIMKKMIPFYNDKYGLFTVEIEHTTVHVVKSPNSCF